MFFRNQFKPYLSWWDQAKNALIDYGKTIDLSVLEKLDKIPLIGTKISKALGKAVPKGGDDKKSKILTFDKLTDDDTKKYETLLQDPSMRKAIGAAASNLDGPVKKTVEYVLSKAFENAYEKVAGSTKKFTNALINDKVFGFIKLGKDIQNIMTEVWNTILEKITATVTTINAQVQAVMLDIGRLTAGIEILNYNKAVANEDGAAPKSKELDANVSTDQQLFNAIHTPDWYFAETGYRRQFAAGIVTLETAIRNLSKTMPALSTQPKGKTGKETPV